MARRACVPNIMPTITGRFFAIPTEIVSRPFAIDPFKNAHEPEVFTALQTKAGDVGLGRR